MEEKLDKIIKLLKALNMMLSVLVVSECDNPNKATKTKMMDELEKELEEFLED